MPRACLEILKRAALIAGEINSAPLKSASFGTFLAETRKVQRINQSNKLKFVNQRSMEIDYTILKVV